MYKTKIMDVKEKAKELVRHFKGRGMDGDENYASKECALIVVGENIKLIKDLLDKSTSIYQSLNTPLKLCVDVLNPALKYYEEVKTEIEKL